jgi:hypothetical protein
MATAVKTTAESQSMESLEQRFRRLEAVWEAETMFLSDAHRIIEHPAFQEIISLGEAVVPYMLRDLEKRPRQWVWALPRITGANPVAPADGGNIRKMGEAWLRWGRENGYQW